MKNQSYAPLWNFEISMRERLKWSPSIKQCKVEHTTSSTTTNPEEKQLQQDWKPKLVRIVTVNVQLHSAICNASITGLESHPMPLVVSDIWRVRA